MEHAIANMAKGDVEEAKRVLERGIDVVLQDCREDAEILAQPRDFMSYPRAVEEQPIADHLPAARHRR
jgi:hypothetical protein